MLLGSKKHPVITSKTLSEFSGDFHLKIPQDLAYFEGHFTDMPVVPGVVQLHWVVKITSEFFNLTPTINKASQVKFMNLMQPNSTPTLTIQIDLGKQLISYKYHHNDTTYSSGKLSYDL